MRYGKLTRLLSTLALPIRVLQVMGGLIALWCALILDENIRGLIFIHRWKSRRWTTKSLV
jgi:Na+-driven multidrug efflux pump